MRRNHRMRSACTEAFRGGWIGCVTTRLAIKRIGSNMIDGRNILKQNFRLMAKARE